MTPAAALEFSISDWTTVRIESLFTTGVLFRMQDPDVSNIGKINLDPGLCVSRTNPTLGPEGTNTFAGDTCTTSIMAANERYVAAPGSYAINADNGNLNFDKGDIAFGTAKLTSDVSFELFDFNFFFRPIMFFDAVNVDLMERHPDTTLQPAETPTNGAYREALGTDFDVLDYYVSGSFPFFGEREISFKLGDQVLNWGESGFLALNSLNTINAPDSTRLRQPGFDLKELFQPQGMLVVGTELFQNVNMDVFYQYEWKPAVADAPGSFFSSSDTAGPGGRYAMLSFGKQPEDPDNLYRARENPNDPFQTLGTEAGRTIYRDYGEETRRLPDDGGQYGAAVKYFAEWLNNGTEFGFYFANYHARIPTASFISSDNGCIPDQDTGTPATNLAQLIVDCEFTPRLDSPGDFDAGQEPAPVDTVKLFLEYPENVRMYGISFNTTVGDFAWSGEYVYRPNLPVQIHTVDLTLAAISPALPSEPINLGVAVVPGNREGTADFVTTYRDVHHRADGGLGYGPNEYIAGYERLKIGQLGTTLLRLIGGDNPIGASQITLLLELGMTHIVDMPPLDEIQFGGAGTDTHISHGGDGTQGIQPRDLRSGEMSVPDDGDPCAGLGPPPLGAQPAPFVALQWEDVNPRCLRQNPTAQNPGDFGEDLSYGYRFIFLSRYESALFGANIENLIGFFHDVDGVAPGAGQNFIGGRKQILWGVRFDYLTKWIGEVRYTWNTGGGIRDPLRDRDNLFVFAGYQF